MIPTYDGELPWLTTEQMIEVDRAMMDDLEIGLIQMMENAGRCLSIVARDRFLGSNIGQQQVVVLAGPGGNGGGALVCARRLAAWGAHVVVVTSTTSDRFRPVPAHQLGIVDRMRVPTVSAADRDELAFPALIIDGLIGYSLKGAPRGGARDLIEWANAVGADILSLDTPSGLDTTTGVPHEPTIRATATLTLALPKQGLQHASDNVGELYLGDISVPPSVYESPPLNLRVGPIFTESDVVRLR